jgi:replicative DNA helicase
MRIYNTFLLKKIATDNGLTDEKTSVFPMFFKDGFKIRNIKHNSHTEDMKQKMLSIFNESINEEYNHIEKKRHNILITKRNYYTEKSGIWATDLETYTRKTKINFNQVNMCLIAATSGKGKTTIAKKLIKQCTQKEITIYTPKPEDYRDYQNIKTFEESEIIELTQKLKRFNEDREYRQEINELIIIDEFYLLCNLNTSKNLITELNKTLAFNRATNLKIIAISQTINRSMLNNFNIALANTMLINVADIENYESSIGKIPKKYKQQIPSFKFLKISLDEPQEIIFIND